VRYDVGMRRLIFRGISLVCVFAGIAATALAQSPIGSIDRIYGFVEIDAFGVDELVEVSVPEAVYQASVVRTDYESWAYLTINGDEFTIGPNSTTPVSTFVSPRRRGRNEGFFARILRELTRSLEPPEDDEIIAGGRAAQVEGTTTDWVFDVDPDELYEEALHQIEAGRFESAVESLRLIEFPQEGDFEIEEYYVNLVYALMGLGDFHAAMTASFEYVLDDPAPDNVGLLTPRLQLLGGVSAYYAGEDAIADASLSAYMESEPIETTAVDAIVIRYILLRDQRKTSDAERLLRNARRAQPDIDWDAAVSQ
jgi:hypothetical protein